MAINYSANKFLIMINVLKFNDKFDSLIEEPINYWKTSDDIPQNIKD